MVERRAPIINKLGLHARAAARLNALANRYAADIRIATEARPDKLVDGKSILAIMLLAAAKGQTLLIRTEGEDAEAAADALCELIANRFDEDE